MNERRKPIETWYKRLPTKLGKKPSKIRQLKIELFPSYLWAAHWTPDNRLFTPKLPLHSGARIEYWQTRYRIRVNGKFVVGRAKFTTFTKQMIREKYFS